MDLRLFNENYKVKFEPVNNENLQTQNLATDSTEEIKVVSPNKKTVTTSISEILKNMETNDAVETLPSNITEGVQRFTYKNTNVTTRLRGTQLQIQIDGYASIKEIKSKLSNLITIPTDESAQSGNNSSGINGVNGEIDEKVSQGGTGDCWLLSGVLALNSTDVGKQIIKNSIKPNPDGSVTVTFNGIGVSYTISASEIKRHDTDNKPNDAYSNGDNDMLVLELAVTKLKKDIAAGKVKLDVDPKSWEAYNPGGSIEGGFAQQILYFLTGKTSTTLIADSPRAGYEDPQTFISEKEIFQMFQEALENGNTVLNFGLYDGTHSAMETNGRMFAIDLGNGGHALAITNLTATTVTFVNPWDSTKEYTMSWEEFAKLGIGMLSSVCLDGIEVPEVDDPVDIDDPGDVDDPNGIKPLNPSVYGKIYSKKSLIKYGFNEEQIEKYFNQLENFYILRSDIKIPGIRGRQGETVKTIQELLDITGISSRNQLKEQGLTDEIIDKYFDLFASLTTGSASYRPKDAFKYTIEQEGDSVTLKFFDNNDHQTRFIRIVNGEVVEDIDTTDNTIVPDKVDIDDDKPVKYKSVGAPWNTLISMGFTPELIEKYFDAPDANLPKDNIKSKIYTLKKDIEVISGSGIYITSIEELAELLKKYGIIQYS